MELRDYLAVLWGRKWVIIITTVATLTVITIGLFLATPQYEATTKLRVATAAGGSIDYSNYLYLDRLLNTYSEIITSGPILGELTGSLDLSRIPEVSVDILPNTELMLISVEDPDPILAAESANTLANILIAQSNELYSGGGKSLKEILSEELIQLENELSQANQEYVRLVAESPGDSDRIEAAARLIELKQGTYANVLERYEQTRVNDAIRANTISVVEPAVIPLKPSKPRVFLSIVLGLFVGLMGGIALAFSFEYVDKTLYTEKQIENATQLRSLGNIPTLKNWRDYPLNGTPFGEAFRRLRVQLIASNPELPLHTLLITSAEVGEGKSVIAANLALSLAQSGKKVIVVDCDLRRPSIHKIFKLPNDIGLSSVLKKYAKLEDVIQNSRAPRLKILTSGPKLTKSSELLGSDQMGSIIRKLEDWFEIVILDTPPLIAVTDAALLSPQADGVVLVISRGQAHEQAVKSAEKQLADIHARLIGVVINRVELDGSNAYYKYMPTRSGR